MRRWDIRTRVLLAAIIPATLIAIVLAWYFTRTRLAELDESLQARGHAVVRQLAAASEYGVFSGNRDLLRQLVESALREDEVAGVVILDAGGETLAGGGRAITPVAKPLDSRSRSAVLHADREHIVFIAPVGQQPIARDELFEMAAAARGRAPDAPILGTVLAQMSREGVEARKSEFIRGAATITLLGLLVAGFLARWLARGVTRPILELADTVAEIERGNLSARAHVRAAGALKLLERGVNDMAESLKEARGDLEQRIAEATAELQRQKERAEQANRTKSQFLAAASHDLRQPLQALGLFVSSLKLRVREPDAAKLVASIERGVESLDNVLEALLDISKLDAGVVSASIDDVPLDPLLQEVGYAFAGTALQHGLKLRVVPTRLVCRSDPLLLSRILSNLVHNALRYTERGGVVLGCRRQGSLVRIEVWDSGAGIPPEKQADIFREFVQAGAPARSEDRGLGLGLAIVERLCRLLNHPLRLRSVPGQGTVFQLFVPRAAEAEEEDDCLADTEDANPLRGRTLLVVDDEEDVLQALSSYLSLRGATVLTADSPEQACQVMDMARGAVDCIVSDYRLGAEEDGLALLDRLRAEFGPDIPGMILTGESAPQALRNLAGSGYPTLSKPVRPQEFEALVGQVVASQSVRTDALRRPGVAAAPRAG